ncbi:hypothetical protein A2U01_0097671, partial [Trifolium medium]|nr:hypothetical protein [Trifolium medium]
VGLLGTFPMLHTGGLLARETKPESLMSYLKYEDNFGRSTPGLYPEG